MFNHFCFYHRSRLLHLISISRIIIARAKLYCSNFYFHIRSTLNTMLRTHIFTNNVTYHFTIQRKTYYLNQVMFFFIYFFFYIIVYFIRHKNFKFIMFFVMTINILMKDLFNIIPNNIIIFISIVT